MTNTAHDVVTASPNHPERRRFTIFDAMTIIAATAVGLALVRYSHAGYFGGEQAPQPGRPIFHTLSSIGTVIHGTLPVLYALCAAVVASIFRRACVWRDALSGSPGRAASFAALVSALAVLVFRALSYAAGNDGAFWLGHPVNLAHHTVFELFCSPDAMDSLFNDAGAAAPPAVLAVWLVQLFGGLWKPMPEWDDRLGRGLGFVLLLWMLTPH